MTGAGARGVAIDRGALAAGVMLLLALAGCSATSGGGAEAHVQLSSADLVLMPVGDERRPSPDLVDVTRDVRNTTLRVLAKKKYNPAARDDLVRGGVAAPRDLGTARAEELAALGPRDAGPLVYVAVTSVRRHYDFGGEKFAVIVSGVIVDPVTARVLWRDTGSGRSSLGGFMRIFSPQSPSYDAVYDAVKNLFRNLGARESSR
jgi:hypothetical protein